MIKRPMHIVMMVMIRTYSTCGYLFTERLVFASIPFLVLVNVVSFGMPTKIPPIFAVPKEVF